MTYFKRGCTCLVVLAAWLVWVSQVDAGGQVKIVAVGDSLTAGYGLNQASAFPVQLEQALQDRGYAVEVVNAGVSGDTAQGGLSRLDWAVPEGTDAVILELGANDALRGIDPAVTAKSLDAMMMKLKRRGIAILLTGMRAPPNMGTDYAGRFNAIYGKLADKFSVLFYPFFLKDVAGSSTLNQPDGMHPNADGVAVVVQNILPLAERLITQVRAGKGAAAQQ